MSTGTKSGRAAGGLRRKIDETTTGVKRRLGEEIADHAVRKAASDSFTDFLGSQIEDAKRLNQRKFDHGHLAEDASERRDRKAARAGEPQSLRARAGQNVDLVGLAIALVIVGVVLYVGLAVMSTTEQSTDLENDSEFNNASNDLTQGISDAYGLSGILFLVLVLTGVVGLLLGLRGRRR